MKEIEIINECESFDCEISIQYDTEMNVLAKLTSIVNEVEPYITSFSGESKCININTNFHVVSGYVILYNSDIITILKLNDILDYSKLQDKVIYTLGALNSSSVTIKLQDKHKQRLFDILDFVVNDNYSYDETIAVIRTYTEGTMYDFYNNDKRVTVNINKSKTNEVICWCNCDKDILSDAIWSSPITYDILLEFTSNDMSTKPEYVVCYMDIEDRIHVVSSVMSYSADVDLTVDTKGMITRLKHFIKASSSGSDPVLVYREVVNIIKKYINDIRIQELDELDCNIINYLGYPLNIIDNVELNPITNDYKIADTYTKDKNGKTIKTTQPNVILHLESRDKLTAFDDSVLVARTKTGVPINEVITTFIKHPDCDPDDIIVVSPVYYRKALMAGVDTTNMYIPSCKIHYDGKIYYTGLTKRL